MCKNILIVHYNPRELKQRADWAAELGLNASTAKNCDEALETISKNEFQLVLIDPLLPGMSGFSLAEKIAASAPKTTVLLASALYKRMQFVTHPGKGNIRMVHLDKPLDEITFKTLITKGYITDINKKKIKTQKKPDSPGPRTFDPRKLLDLESELDNLLH